VTAGRGGFPPPPSWSRALPTIGVTGTNGKTTTTAWVAAALRAGTSAPVVRATTVGVFLDDELLDLPPTYDGFLAAMRAGLERGGRAAAIELTSEALAAGFATAWPVRVGVFTNLTHDHLDAHGSAEHYLASKAQLFVHLPPDGAAVLNGRDPAWSLLAEVLPPGIRTIFYGAPGRGGGEGDAPLDLVASRVEPTWSGTDMIIAAPAAWGAPGSLRVRAIGEVYAENALAALAGAVAFGIPADVAARAIAAAPAPPGRFEIVAERPYLVVDYAHSPDALERAVRTAKRLCEGRVTVVFGAGGDRDREKRGPMGRAARLADRVIVTSDNPRREDPAAIAAAIRTGLEGHPGAETILDRGGAIEAAVRDAGPDDVVLVAGRGHEAEQIFAEGRRPFSDVAVLRRLAEGGRGDEGDGSLRP
jgi:UDP-N-acetylmuramoyl-L-alanyl-D-glutamate--2,6-diaminopimelate ligase